MATKCYGVGVIGCGVIWNQGHWAQGLKHIPDEAKVRYVYDIDDNLTRAASDKTGALALDKPEAMFEADDVDIITLATPPFARVEYVKRACAEGKHLMVEKPMARTLSDALTIFQLVRESGVKCFVPFSRACSAKWRQLVEIIESGELGEPVAFVHTNLGAPYGWVPLDHWMHDMEKSGGPIFDYSIHFIEMARACMQSEAQQVCYAGTAITGRVKSDDHATLLVEYENGAFGEFTKSWDFPPEVNLAHQTTHIVCREAVAVLDGGVKIYTSDGVRELSSKDTAPGRAESYCNLIASIEDGTPLYASELEGLRTIEILDAALTSRETGQKQPVYIHARPDSEC